MAGRIDGSTWHSVADIELRVDDVSVFEFINERDQSFIAM